MIMLTRDNLHFYQKRAVDYILNNRCAGLFIEMGLGKTVIMLTALSDLIEQQKVSKVLVIAPKRVAETVWPAEVVKWRHLQHLRVSLAAGSPSKRLQALDTEADIYVIGRDNVTWLVDNFDLSKFDTLVIDESSSFKDPKTKRFKALRKVLPKFARRYILTGTPAPNSYLDLWSQIYILDLGETLFNSYYKYRGVYFRKKYPNAQFSPFVPRLNATRDIDNKIKHLVLSMRSEDYIKLPDFVYNNIYVKIPERQYVELAKHSISTLEDEAITAKNAAVLANKLLQLTAGAAYTKNGEYKIYHSEKLQALKEVIEAAQGKSVLVVYKFKFERDIILKNIKEAQVLDTQADFDAWNAGNISVGLIHPASAGHGINLQQGGNIIVWTTPTWSREHYDQTNARLRRQGQQSNKVFVHHILAAGTIDEKVMSVLRQKGNVQEALVRALRAHFQPGTTYI